MPRVPVSDSPGVAQAAARPQYLNPDTRDGTQALQAGVGELAQGIGNVQAVNDERARRAKQRADEIAADSVFAQAQQFTTEKLHGKDNPSGPDVVSITTGADNSFVSAGPRQSGGNGEHVPGYLDSRGTEAHAQSGDTLDSIQKKYESLLSVAGTPEQKAIVQRRLLTLYESVRAQVAEHEGQQFKVADQAATAGLLSTTLNSAATLYDRPNDVAKLTEDALASLKRSALPEEFEAKKQDFLSKVSQTRINGFLQADDIAGAQALYNNDKQLLGDDGRSVKAQIDDAVAADQRSKKAARDATDAAQILKNATPDVGYADPAAAIAQLKNVSAESRAEVTAQVKQLLALDAEAQKAEFDKDQTLAHGAYNNGGLAAVPKDVLQRLNTQYGPAGPAFVDRLQSEADAKWRRAKADAKSDKSSDAAERRAQAEANHRARNDYLSMPLDERSALNVDTEFLGSGANPLGLSELRRLQQVDKANIQTHAAQGEADFMRAALASVQDRGLGKSATKDFKAEAVLAFQGFLEKNKRRPNAAETTAEIGTLIQNGETEPGLLYGYNSEPEWKRRQRERQALGKGQEPQQPPALTEAKNKQALDWAHAHPADPRSAAILKKLGAQ